MLIKVICHLLAVRLGTNEKKIFVLFVFFNFFSSSNYGGCISFHILKFEMKHYKVLGPEPIIQ